jgi:hypothetical protein
LAVNTTYHIIVSNIEDREVPAHVLQPNPTTVAFRHPVVGSFSATNNGPPGVTFWDQVWWILKAV